MSEPNTTDKLLTMLQEELASLLNNNINGVLVALMKSDDGKLTASVSIKLVASLPKVYSKCDLSYGVRLKDSTEASVEVDDPRQARLEVEE